MGDTWNTDDFVRDIGRQYDRVQSALNRRDDERQYLNFGFRARSDTPFPVTQERLCLEVFAAAEIPPDATILDVGFGSGDQDLLLAEHFSFGRLIGVNVSRTQVERARDRIHSAGLGDRMEFHVCSAEELTMLDDDSVDRVLAVECAMYFDRSRFYQEAARILKRDGRIALADLAWRDWLKPWTGLSTLTRRFGTLGANRAAWSPFFRTMTTRNISPFTRPGAGASAWQCLARAAGEARHGRWRNCRACLELAGGSAAVWFFLGTGLMRYELIVLEAKA